MTQKEAEKERKQLPGNKEEERALLAWRPPPMLAMGLGVGLAAGVELSGGHFPSTCVQGPCFNPRCCRGQGVEGTLNLFSAEPVLMDTAGPGSTGRSGIPVLFHQGSRPRCRSFHLLGPPSSSVSRRNSAFLPELFGEVGTILAQRLAHSRCPLYPS